MSGGIQLPLGSGSGLAIAFPSQAFNTNPSWNPLIGVQSFTVSRGRSYLLSKTQTGTATITLLDQTGKYDPTNANGPYYREIGPMRSVNIQLLDQATKQFRSIFTGFTETWDFTYPMTPAATILQAAVSCVDGFDPLSRAEMPPDAANTTTIPPFVGLDAVKGRMLYILSFFTSPAGYGMTLGYPTDPAALFSGNVNVFNAVYNPQTALLTGIQDTADAEFPNVSNTFMDKYGNLAFRGRGTRFVPEQYWNGAAVPPTLQMPVSFWNIGDANACGTWPTNPPGSPSSGAMAPFYDLEWSEDQTLLIDAAQVYPGNIGTQTAAITAQTVTNGLQLNKFGPRVLSIPNLYTAGSPASTGNPFLNPPGLTAKQECLLFANYFVENLAAPEPYISALKFQTVLPGTTRGNAWWKFVTSVELGDVIVLYQTNPGGGGLSQQQFFVEKLDYTVNMAAGPYPQISLTLQVTPRVWFSVFNGFIFYPTNGFFSQHGNPTHGSAVFNDAVDNPFTINSVGQTLIVQDPTAPAVPGVNPESFEVVGFTNPSTVTLDHAYTGATSMVAPFEIIGV